LVPAHEPALPDDEPRRRDRAARLAGAVPLRDGSDRARAVRGGGADARRAFALALMLPAYALHGLLDIDWDFAAITATVLLVAGALVARSVPARRFSPGAALAGSGVALAALGSLFALWL